MSYRTPYQSLSREQQREIMARQVARAKNARKAVQAFQAQQAKDPRFAEVVKAQRTHEYARRSLVDFQNWERFTWADTQDIPVEVEEASRKRELERTRQALGHAIQEARYLGRVDVPSQSDDKKYWTVSYYIDNFTGHASTYRSFDTLDGAEAFRKHLLANKGKRISEVAGI